MGDSSSNTGWIQRSRQHALTCSVGLATALRRAWCPPCGIRIRLVCQLCADDLVIFTDSQVDRHGVRSGSQSSDLCLVQFGGVPLPVVHYDGFCLLPTLCWRYHVAFFCDPSDRLFLQSSAWCHSGCLSVSHLSRHSCPTECVALFGMCLQFNLEVRRWYLFTTFRFAECRTSFVGVSVANLTAKLVFEHVTLGSSTRSTRRLLRRP